MEKKSCGIDHSAGSTPDHSSAQQFQLELKCTIQQKQHFSQMGLKHIKTTHNFRWFLFSKPTYCHLSFIHLSLFPILSDEDDRQCYLTMVHC